MTSSNKTKAINLTFLLRINRKSVESVDQFLYVENQFEELDITRGSCHHCLAQNLRI